MPKQLLFLLCATALLFLAAGTHAQETDAGIAEKNAKLDALLNSLLPHNGPGAAVVVIQDGKKIFEKFYGFADVADKIPIAAHTNFELASCSKQFTAMAVMILAEEGKLKYSDHLSKFFPEFRAVGHEITIDELLHHTGGLQDYFDVFDKHGKGAITSHHVMEVLAKQPTLRFTPGEKYEYSNSGYMVLAQIVEKASGKRYPEFLKEKIFEPLKMDDTLVYDETHPHIKHSALCYKHSNDGFKKIEHDDWDCVYGDGSIHSTVDDLYKWDQALYTEKLVKATTLEEAFTEGKLTSGKGTGYGFGWGIEHYQAKKVVSHEGEWLGYENLIYRIPELHFSVLLLSNGSFAKQCDKCAAEIVKVYYPGR